MFVKWKYTAHEKIGVKVDRFLKIVRKISNLNKSRRLIYKIRNFLPRGFEIYAIWVDCLVNKLSQIPDVNSGFIRHFVAQIRWEKWWPIWVHSWLKGYNSNVCTMLLKCVGNHNRLCLKCSNCHKVMINHRVSYKLALHII